MAGQLSTFVYHDTISIMLTKISQVFSIFEAEALSPMTCNVTSAGNGYHLRIFILKFDSMDAMMVILGTSHQSLCFLFPILFLELFLHFLRGDDSSKSFVVYCVYPFWFPLPAQLENSFNVAEYGLNILLSDCV